MPYHLAMGQDNYKLILSQNKTYFNNLTNNTCFVIITLVVFMNINYQKKLDEIINSLDTKKSLLLQVCCAPCSSYCIEYLRNYFDITILYYNPNISPVEEYNKRLEEVKRFVNSFEPSIKLLECNYDGDKFDSMAKGLEDIPEGGSRCYKCYKLRLEETAKIAKENNFDYFGTTLSISPYKNAAWLNEIGKSLEKKYNISYLYADFKKKNGYKRSIELSNIYNLYRQDYCGCIYSKIARDKRINKEF